MSKHIILISTLDTKGEEILFLKEMLEKKRLKTITMDIGTLKKPLSSPDISRGTIAKAGGASLAELKNFRRRDRIMEVMAEGAKKTVAKLFKSKKTDGIIGLGGNQGTAVAAIAMRDLPFGIPKIIISTVASGNIRPYIGNKDIMMMFSVADLLGGVNTITKSILTNAASAMAGMVQTSMPVRKTPGKKPLIALTAFGNTHPAIDRAVRLLEKKGYETVTFHASGACGSAMEELIEQGMIDGVLDITTHELLGEIYKEDIYTPVRPGRLEAACKKGIPQVIAPGGLNYFCFGGADTIPRQYRKRKIHYHNPYNTNVKTNRKELSAVSRLMAERLNRARGPVTILIPLKGWTENSRTGQPLYSPETDRFFVRSLKSLIKPPVTIREVNAHLNDPLFAETAVISLHELYQQTKRRKP
jgi:uncharacterized protein (UPF0261 family)